LPRSKPALFAAPLLLLSALAGPVGAGIPIPQNDLIPVPSAVQWNNGWFILQPGFCAVVSPQGAQDARAQAALERFLIRLGDKVGFKPCADSPSKESAPTMVVSMRRRGLAIQGMQEDESYALQVSREGIQLQADNALGVMHGLETILQLLQRQDSGFALPWVSIQDSPRFRWRGLMIDASRHWQGVEVIKRNLDGMAFAKMNVLHWHLSDDQGFRVECRTYPLLQDLGSGGNFYTQDQVRDVIAYARARGIRVVPEFDMPGHTTAWQVAYPDLGSALGPYAPEQKFGIFDPTFDPSREEVFSFLDAFLGEMAALFPDACMHLGGDENNGKLWNANPKIQAFMLSRHFRSNEDLQAYFSGRVSKILASHGKHMVGWDEILQSQLPKGTVVHAWRSPDLLLQATGRGYDTILSNGYYLDLAHPASDHYLRDPMPADLTLSAQQQSHLIGGEACMWSELVDQDTIDSRIWPRTLAIAERLWSPAQVKDLPDFYRRMDRASLTLSGLGLRHLSHKAELLKSLMNGADTAPLVVLADALAPLQFYQRHRSRPYTQSTPLDRLVDAVEPDTPGVRHFKSDVDDFLGSAPDFSAEAHLEGLLQSWKANDKILGPMLAKSDRTVDAAPLSQDLAALGTLGLDALRALKSGKEPRADWQSQAARVMVRAAEPKAELELAVLPSVRKLVLAAENIATLKAAGAAQWNKDLDSMVEKASPKRNPW
jgi:hexosaminidase